MIRRVLLVLILAACSPDAGLPQAQATAADFVRRDGSNLTLGGRPFWWTGANAYFLMESAARGDTAAVHEVFASARSLGMKVVRTWAFHDSPDSLDPTVMQFRPGAFNERALRALDYVVARAPDYGLRLILPLVNSWDDYGGMNQYARWRAEAGGDGTLAGRGPEQNAGASVRGTGGRAYRVRPAGTWGHDNFYTDSLMRSWFRAYLGALTGRMNSLTGTAYRDDPAIMAWELANEPRSSDPTGRTVAGWAAEMSAHLKALDGNHLIGVGEEGFDVGTVGYTLDAYGGQQWLFDGTAGVSFSRNAALPSVDIAGIHLYPESWNISPGTGNAWIADHVRIARDFGKPLMVGEFGARFMQESTYRSWLTTALAEGAPVAAVWQLLDRRRPDDEGYGIRCPDDAATCAVLARAGGEFAAATAAGAPAVPAAAALRQNYPNPFNAQTIIEYDLPFDAQVDLSVFDATGRLVVRLVDGWQGAGVRRELFETSSTRLDRLPLSSGAYWYRLEARSDDGRVHRETKNLVLLK